MTSLPVDLFFIMLKGVINVYNACGPDAVVLVMLAISDLLSSTGNLYFSYHTVPFEAILKIYVSDS